ncbi:phosphotransferase [Streptomyces sp. SID3343]|uniref:phosphotransferase n=1 Tax=Streptomyces sp. SID3343 TaxID=2690260 RepID=UPI001371DE23|nr:phosphotransferase [Streptomyces sp. SID3343]
MAQTDAVDPDDLDLLEREFRLGTVSRANFLTAGLMNRNWRVETTHGKVFALKLLRDVSSETARRSAAVQTALAAAGLPVCTPVTTRAGEPALEIGLRTYLVSPWVEGAHVEGTDLLLAEVADLGGLVGTIHEALNDPARVPLPPADARPIARVTEPEAAVEKAERLLARIAETSEPTAFDACAVHLLEERKLLLDKHRSGRPADGEVPGPYGWTHGDLQYRNLLRADGGITAVLDWDRVAVKPFAEEVARTAQVQFGGEHGRLDLDRVAAFVTGYRAIVPLSRDELADAVDRLWWKRMTDYWIAEFHYYRDDHGPDSLMLPSEQLLAWWTDHRDDVAQAFAAGA